jgi:hypothetical protein
MIQCVAFYFQFQIIFHVSFYILWRVDALLGNGRETNNKKMAVAK